VENDLLQHEDTFAKTVAVASRILTGWNGKYNDRDYKTTDVNDGVAFAITSEEENSKSHKKKVITLYKCKNTDHYANKCE